MICSRSRDYLFQSTLLQEERQHQRVMGSQKLRISIHAPTRGATNWGLIQKVRLIFQSTLLQEERPGLSAKQDFGHQFQSTLLQEERLNTLWSVDDHDGFQSTLLQEERPYNFYPFRCYIKISIHAPTRGATFSCKNPEWRHIISIHAPTRGATISRNGCRKKWRFQSTLLQEERQQKCTIFLMHLCNNYCIVSI